MEAFFAEVSDIFLYRILTCMSWVFYGLFFNWRDIIIELLVWAFPGDLNIFVSLGYCASVQSEIFLGQVG